MMFLVCAAGISASDAQEGWQTVHDQAVKAVPQFASAISGLVKSETQGADGDGAMAAHFGGGEQPPLALIVSIWMPESELAGFRAYERRVLNSGLFHGDYSYFLFTREVEILSV